MHMGDFKRTKEVNRLLSLIGNGKIIIVSGLRRVGKTFLLSHLFKDKLISDGSLFTERDIGMLFLDGRDKGVRSEDQLDGALNDMASKGKKIVIIDEIQLVDGFVSSLTAFAKLHKEITVYVTGSNSHILSKDIVREFQGNCVSIKIEPLTYREIIEEMPDYPIESYVAYGGLPLVIKKASDQERSKELHIIFEEIFVKDIDDRMRQEGFKYISSNEAKQIIAICASNLSAFSPSKTARRIMKGSPANGDVALEVSKEVSNFVSLLENSFLLKAMELEDYRRHTPLEKLNLKQKYYFSDNGLRFINCSFVEAAMGNCLENAVFLELMSRGIKPVGKVSLGKRNETESEIDFDFINKGVRHLFQVTHTINFKDYSREIQNLLQEGDNAKKAIIYIDNAVGITEEGISYLQKEAFFLQ